MNKTERQYLSNFFVLGVKIGSFDKKSFCVGDNGRNMADRILYRAPSFDSDFNLTGVK